MEIDATQPRHAVLTGQPSPLRVVLAALIVCLAAACGDSTETQAVDLSPNEAVRVYATVSGDHSITVSDEDLSEVLGTIPVGEGPAIILATPGTKKLYTANWANNTVSAVDTTTLEVTSIDTGGRPYVIAMSRDGKRIYAGINPSGIAVIDTETDTIIETFPTSGLAASLIVSPDGKTLYVAALAPLFIGPGTLRAISTETGEIIHDSIEVGGAPAWITIHPDGSKVYTLNFTTDDITVVETETFTVEATIDTGTGSQAIIANCAPDGGKLWVTNHGTAELIAIDTKTNEIVQTIELDGRPVGVEFNEDGSRIYVTDFGIESLASTPDLSYLLSGTLTATGPGQLSVFDTATGKRIGEKLQVGPGATSIVISDEVD